MILTLNRAFNICDAMWRDIADRAGRMGRVAYLKSYWMKTHYPREDFYADCPFCEYALRRFSHEHNRMPLGDEDFCVHCPGRTVDPTFDCMDLKYHYSYRPLLFRDQIHAMNQERKAKK